MPAYSLDGSKERRISPHEAAKDLETWTWRKGAKMETEKKRLPDTWTWRKGARKETEEKEKWSRKHPTSPGLSGELSCFPAALKHACSPPSGVQWHWTSLAYLPYC